MFNFINPFQPSVAFHACHLFFSTKQMTGFHMKHNAGMEWLTWNKFHTPPQIICIINFRTSKLHTSFALHQPEENYASTTFRVGTPYSTVPFRITSCSFQGETKIRQHIFAQNNKMTKNEPQAVRTVRKNNF